MNTLVQFDDVKVNDSSAILASRGTAHATEPVDAFVRFVLYAADAITSAAARVPAPLLLQPRLPAWRAFAERLRGRLELGRMFVHDGVVGLDSRRSRPRGSDGSFPPRGP